MTALPASQTQRSDRGGSQESLSTVRHLLRSWLTIEMLVLVFGCWTLGFWAALSVGIGWVGAVPIAAAVFLLFVLGTHRWPAESSVAGETESAAPVALVAVLVFGMPLLIDRGRAVMVTVLFSFVAIHAAASVVRRTALAHGRVIVALSAAVLLTLAFATGWVLVAIALTVLGLAALIHPDWFESSVRARNGDGPAPTLAANRLGRTFNTAILSALGSFIGIWYVGTAAFWNPDNTYYLNKAAHYGQSARSFEVKDYMFGAADTVTHIPFGNILASYEPLIGTLARWLGVSSFDLAFTAVVPVAMFLVPFAMRWGAAGLGVSRPSLVGALAAAYILLTTASDTVSLFANASLGKSVGVLLVAPVFVGELGLLVRHVSRQRALRAVLAAVALVGVTPSLAISGLFVSAAFAGAVFWNAWRQRPSAAPWRSLLLTCSPFCFLVAFSLFAQLFQESSGESQFATGFRAFAAPEGAWSFAYGPGGSTLGSVFLILGSVAVMPFVMGSHVVRYAWALVLIGFYGLLFSPWGFGPLIGDLLDLNYFAWRFFWVLPGALLVGLAISEALSERTPLPLIAAVVIGLAVSGPTLNSFFRPQAVRVWEAPNVLPWDGGADPGLLAAARAMVSATPQSSRYLGPAAVEEVATALQTNRKPTYARLNYVQVAANDPSIGKAFHAADRVLLGQAIAGGAEKTDPARLERALMDLNVRTVCLSEAAAEPLRQVVQQRYSADGATSHCELWTR